MVSKPNIDAFSLKKGALYGQAQKDILKRISLIGYVLYYGVLGTNWPSLCWRIGLIYL
jgi:hypothetical protein